MEINRADVLASLTKAFYDYEESLVNNNIERLNNLFFSHERTIRYGTNAREHLLGHEAIAAFRRSRPPGPSGSYSRTISETLITSFGECFGTASCVFSRPGEKRVGRQQQSWLLTERGWQIVAAHVSFADD